jgi:hypothetical protein
MYLVLLEFAIAGIVASLPNICLRLQRSRNALPADHRA